MNERNITMKGIATETIAKMLIVVIVVAIVVVILYLYVVHSSLGEAVCRGLMTTWCGSCEMTKTDSTYSGGSKMSDRLKKCIDDYGFATKRDSCVDAENDCKGFIPQKTT
jgi:hypothetical protein